MKILNILTSRLNYNGIGMSLLNYYRNIDSSLFQMDYLVPNIVDNDLKEKFTVNGNKLFELDYHGQKMHQKRPFLYCCKLYKILKEEKYDIVHVHGSSSLLFLQLLVAKLAGVKVRIAHSRNTDTDHKFIHFVFKPLFSLLYTDAFSCGREAGVWLFGKNKDFTIISNGKDSKMVAFNQLDREFYRKKYNIKDKIVLGHIGNFNYQKNHEFLIDVFSKLHKENKSCFLILAGSGPLEDEIKERVSELKLGESVLFLGQVSVEEIAKILNAMDIMVFPSRFEGFPNVLIEWQMNGLPCVISDKITKDVKITNSVYFESIDSVDDWVQRINSIKLSDREKIKKETIQLVKQAGYDIEENAKMLEKKYIELYNNCRK